MKPLNNSHQIIWLSLVFRILLSAPQTLKAQIGNFK